MGRGATIIVEEGDLLPPGGLGDDEQRTGRKYGVNFDAAKTKNFNAASVAWSVERWSTQAVVVVIETMQDAENPSGPHPQN